MKRIELFGMLQVFPVQLPNPEPEATEPGEGKQLVFTDREGGEVLLYTMDNSMAKNIGTKLKMNNKQLVAMIQDESEREAARARLIGGSGGNGGVPQREQEIASDILRGVHRKEE